MTEQVQTEQKEANVEKIKAAYEKANIGGQAVIRSALAINAVMDSQLERPIKVDAIVTTLKALVADIELCAFERVIGIAAKTNVPLRIAIAQTIILRAKESDEHTRKLANIMTLFLDEAEQRAKAKTAEAVS